jgi:hypothetical protein
MAQWQEDLVSRLDAPVAVTETNPQLVTPVFRPANAALTAVIVTAASSVVVPENLLRRRLILVNDSGSVVYVAFGPVASTSLYSVRLQANDRYEGVLGDYTGVVSAVRASGTSTLLVTEITT